MSISKMFDLDFGLDHSHAESSENMGLLVGQPDCSMRKFCWNKLQIAWLSSQSHWPSFVCSTS